MPEGLYREPDLVKAVKGYSRDKRPDAPYPTKDFIKQNIVPLFPETEFVGKGTEYVVVNHPYAADKVVAYAHSMTFGPPLRALEIYNFHKFFNRIFPHNFPRFYASFGGDESYTVREKIVKGKDRNIKYPFNQVVKTCKNIGIPLIIDDSSGNFIISPDGGEYFVDTVMNVNSYIFWEGLDEEKLQKYMDKNGFSLSRQKEVWLSLRRLKELETIFTLQVYTDQPDQIPPEWKGDIHGFWNDIITKSGFDPKKSDDIASRKRIIKTAMLYKKD